MQKYGKIHIHNNNIKQIIGIHKRDYLLEKEFNDKTFDSPVNKIFTLFFDIVLN